MNDTSRDMMDFEHALMDNLAEEITVGSVVEGTIAAIHGDVALVDIGGKSEAVLDRTELDELGTGDPVEVVVVSVEDEVRVSRRLALEQRSKEKLGEALSNELPVEGKVVGRRKGGFDVTVAGMRGFCPASHISDLRSDDLDQHLGKTYRFKILEYSAEDRKLVLSRAALLREEKEQARREAWERLEVGAVVDANVRSLTDFGAFVDLGGVDGLVHVTEISHRRVGNPRDVLEEGQPVTVKILDIDREKNRISLSIKQLEKDPWSDVGDTFSVRAPFAGVVVRKAPFGAFVELAAGVDGLLHVSQLPPGLELEDPTLEVGQEISGWIREVDPENHRIGLTLREVPDHDPWERVEMRYQEGQTVEGVVENGSDFGVFVELEPGISALIPASELGQDRNVDPRTVYEPGATVAAKVLSVDPERRRISLSVRAQQRDLERQEYLQHMDRGNNPSGGSAMTGFGAQLRAALEKKD